MGLGIRIPEPRIRNQGLTTENKPLPRDTSRSTSAEESERELIQSIWAVVRDHLEVSSDRIREEIRNYPLPIPACDEQYNHLLQQRDRISRELGRMHESSKGCLTAKDTIVQLEEFMRSSDFVDAQAEQRIRSALKDQLAKLEI